MTCWDDGLKYLEGVINAWDLSCIWAASIKMMSDTDLSQEPNDVSLLLR